MLRSARRAPPRRRGSSCFVFVFSAFAVALGAGDSAAQSAPVAEPAADASAAQLDLATRRMLIDQAQQARTAGDHRLALERAEQAMRIQRTPSLRLFVAQTLAALVRPADALTQAEACVREAERDPSLPNREALLASCRQVLEETRPAIATLALVLRGERPSDAAVTVGARVVSGALLDVPIALNPGRVAIVARASGFAPIEQTIELARGERRSLELAFERAPQSTTTTVERAITSPPPRAVTVEPRRPLPVGPIVTLSVGAVALVTGAVTFALRNGEIASCPIEGGRFVCADSTAADALVARASSAESLNTVTNIALVSGGVLLAGGAAWLVADRLVRRERAPIAVAPTVGRAQLGITAGGRF